MAYTSDEWWTTTMGGQRWGWLMPTEFVSMVAQLTGDCVHGTRSPLIRLSLWLGVGKSTVYRWADGTDPIPKWVALMLKSSLELQEHGKAILTDVEADWLPYSDGANGRQRPVEPPDGGTQAVLQNPDIDSQNLAFSHWGRD